MKTTLGNKMLDISGVNVSAANAQCVSSWNFGMVNSGHFLILILATLHAKAHTHTHTHTHTDTDTDTYTHRHTQKPVNLTWNTNTLYPATTPHTLRCVKSWPHMVFNGMRFAIKMSEVGAPGTTILTPPPCPRKLKTSGERWVNLTVQM